MRKFVIGLLACTILLGVNLSFTKSTEAAAGPDRTEKEGMVTYDVYEVTHYFTPSKTKEIVADYEDRDATARQVMRGIASAYPVVGFMLLAESISTARMMDTFQDAEAQGKGVRTKYEYWNGNTSQSVHKIKNKSVTIE
ncbi:hypothetical protein [Oceanobacillus sp. J11TS1]|uniref:hypothetical protein n=1 Tax=Oceanobacillus sp. J11TS1 TaxID=2807191 RepID=UPI001B12172D|nr:hypothetical protein [Oceanobacillus sp. J11TS1]GIO24552.1 hypothetical protein J11TS1_31330 [Oceanobacillus sp. J11TS1]